VQGPQAVLPSNILKRNRVIHMLEFERAKKPAEIGQGHV